MHHWKHFRNPITRSSQNWYMEGTHSDSYSHRMLVILCISSSDKTIATLAKNVQQELLPPTIDESQEDGKETPPTVVPLEVVEKAIQFVATRVNWGLDNGVAVCRLFSQIWHPIAYKHPGCLCMEMGSY